MTEERKPCDVNDIICQIETLTKMKNLRSAFQDETFQKEFPSLVELEPKLAESIKEKEIDIRGKLEGCNLPSLEEVCPEETETIEKVKP